MRNFLFSYLRDFNIIKLKKRNQLCICILFRYFIYLSFYLFIWQKIDQLNSQSKSTLYLYFIQVFYLFIILFIYLAERIDNPSNLPLRIAHNLLQEQNIFPKSGKLVDNPLSTFISGRNKENHPTTRNSHHPQTASLSFTRPVFFPSSPPLQT